MEIAIVLAILCLAVILFANERFSVDLVAFFILSLLIVTRSITASQAISGFSNPATVTVAAMFVMSAALERTGALEWLGHKLIRIGTNYTLLLISIMFTVGIASAFVNNTAVVAMMIPIVMVTASKKKIPPSLLLIPVSFASQAGGVMTLIGTSTNLIVSSIAHENGFAPISMFEMGKLGFILFILTLVYFSIFGRSSLPKRRSQELTITYALSPYITELRVKENSQLIGQTITQTKLTSKHDVKVIKVIRDKESLSQPKNRDLQEGDILLVEGKIQDLLHLKDFEGLEIEPEFKLKDETLKEVDTLLVEALIPPRSRLIGTTLTQLDFYSRFKLVVLAMQRRGKTLYNKLGSIVMDIGDMLLIQGHKDEVEKLRVNKNFIVLYDSVPPRPHKRKAPIALAILAFVVLLPTLNIMPIVASAILGSVAILVTRCLSTEEIYEAIDWRIIFLLAGILPLGVALEQSKAAEWLATNTIGTIGHFGPFAALAALYLFTTVLTEAMSNNAAAVLLTPIAISIANEFQVDARPFFITVAFAASTSFLTPIGYQTNAMIMGPGGYRYTDFMKVGLPLNLLFWGISSCLIPIFWPF